MYAAMGTMRLSDLREGIERRWGEFFLDEADITSGLMPWEVEVVTQCVQPADRVLVIGCGTGRDLLALAEMGFRVTGLEPSARASRLPPGYWRERRVNVPIIHGFFEDAPLDTPFDVISFSWFCYSYIPDSRRRVAVLEKAARHLAPGGRILISCRSMGEAPSSRLIDLQRFVARLSGSDWRLEKGDIVAPFRWTGHTTFSYEHVFVPGEFEAEAALAGLQIVFRNREEWVFALRADLVGDDTIDPVRLKAAGRPR